MYNNAFLKHHVPFNLSFKSGQKINFAKDYFKFDGRTPLSGKAILLSSEYLWYAVFRLRDIAAKNHTPDSMLTTAMLATAQNQFVKSEIGDVVKMRLLYNAYAHSKDEYQGLLSYRDLRKS